MVLHLTKKLAEKLKMSPKPVTAADEFLSWRANYVQEHGFRLVVFMNDASRFTVVINDAKAVKLKKLPEHFIQTLRDTLLVSINPEVVDRYIADLDEITYAKNANRKRTSQLIRNAESACYALRDFSGNVELSLAANNTIYNYAGKDDAIVPKKKMVELLGKYGLPVRKCCAFDLNVRLALDGKDAVRRLRVPANITFNILHRLLQKAFGWKNYHLFRFGLYKEWKKDLYADPDVELVISEEDIEINPEARLMEGVKLSDYVPEYIKIIYHYDYGDNWYHFIEVENIINNCEEELPVLLSGEGDSPPEDVGGPGGYADFLEIIADPEHGDYRETKEWAEAQWWGPFDFEMTARLIKNIFKNQTAPATVLPPILSFPCNPRVPDRR